MVHRARNRLAPGPQAGVVESLFEVVAVQGAEALHGDAAQQLGLESPEQLRKIITDPVYKGINRLGSDEYPWEPYRLVSDKLWQQANAVLAPARRSPSEPEVMQAAMRDRIGLVQWLTNVVDTGRCPCRICGQPLAWNGYVIISNLLVPQLICPDKHTDKWTDLESIQAGSSRRSCFGCNNDDQRRFTQWREGPFWKARCKVCGWRTGKLTCPAFAPLRQEAEARRLYHPDKVAQGTRKEQALQT